MRIAILSDIHANFAALEAVIAEIDRLGIQTVWCLGDTVGYGAHPNQCLDIVRTRCAQVLAGNHDRGAVGAAPVDDFNENAFEAIQWTRGELEEEHVRYLRGLPLVVTAGSCTLAHASPLEPSEWRYLASARGAARDFGAFSTRLCFIGHTHIPLVLGEDGTINRYTTERRYIVNVGSVGQPRDGVPSAAFGIFDIATERFELVRVPYAVEEAARAIVRAGLPARLAQRLHQGT